MTPAAAILMLVVPAILAAGVLFAAGMLAARLSGGPGVAAAGGAGLLVARLTAPVVFGLGLWSADFALNQWHPVWPKDGTVRYLAVVLAACAAGLLHAGVSRGWLTALVRGLLGAGVAAMVLGPLAGGRYVPWPVFWWLLAASAVWLSGVGAVVDRSAARLPRLVTPLALVACAAVVAPGLFASTYAGGAQLVAALASLAGGAGVAVLLVRRARVDCTGGWTVWLAVFAAIMLVTFGYTDVPVLWALAVLAAAPVGVGAGLLARGRAVRVIAALVGVFVIAGAGTVAAAVGGGDDGSADDDGSYYGY